MSSPWRLETVSSVSVQGRFWRMLSPRWASKPLSGDGAAFRGGRWNPPGQPTLYLSENHGVAVAEYLQGVLRPGLLTPYEVASDHVLDLVDPARRAAAGVDQDLLRLNWREIRDVHSARPASWDLAEAAVKAGFVGLLVPSAMTRQGANIVLWRWGGQDGAEVIAIDPQSDLPRDGRSWGQP